MDNREIKVAIINSEDGKLDAFCIDDIEYYHSYILRNYVSNKYEKLDLLDLERTGQISHDEATYEYVLRHASKNPWYVYRFGLTGYCLRHNIPIPDFSIDNDGFMINKESGERLRPEYLLRNWSFRRYKIKVIRFFYYLLLEFNYNIVSQFKRLVLREYAVWLILMIYPCTRIVI